MKMITEDVEELQSQNINYLDESYSTFYVWNNENWIDFYNDEPLTNFKPPKIKFKFYE
jgi:hypothetical protein